MPGPRPPIGISFWHFACAALNTGDEGSTPAPVLKWNPPPGLRVWEVGHAVGAHALGVRERLRRVVALRGRARAGRTAAGRVARAVSWSPCSTLGGRAPVLAAVDVEVVELATFATLGLPELPPHPATRTPLTSAAAASRRARGELVSLFGCIAVSHLGSFWSASGLRSGSTLAGGYGKVSLLEVASGRLRQAKTAETVP